jgi:MFS family permease
VATYFVELGTHSGLGTTVTGNLLSLSALFAIAVRITAGALTDRAPHRNSAVIVRMMLTGGLGLALIAIGTSTTFVLGAILAFSAGWGWTGRGRDDRARRTARPYGGGTRAGPRDTRT